MFNWLSLKICYTIKHFFSFVNNEFPVFKQKQMLLFTPFTVTQPKFIPDCLRQWNFGLYVSGFWHIHAKTPRGIVACEQ